MDDYIPENESQSSFSLKPLFFLLGIIVSPGILLTELLFYLIFKKGRQKRSVLYTILLVTAIPLFLSLFIVKPFNNFDNLIRMYVYLCLLTAWLLFLFYSWWFPRQLDKKPELKAMNGWRRDFVYKQSFYDEFKRNWLIKELKEGKMYSIDKAPLGVLDEKAMVSEDGHGNIEYFDKQTVVDSYYAERNKHTLATGATGAGKTITLLSQIKNDFEVGNTVCVIDFKKSQDWIYFLSKWAKENNRPFYHFTSGKLGRYNNPYAKFQASYDPLAKGSIQSKADMVLNMRTWDGAAEVYKKQTQTLLVSIFYLLENVNKKATQDIIPWDKGGLAQFVAALKVENLTFLIGQLEKDFIVKESKGITITESDNDKLNQLKSLYTTLTTRGGALKEQIDNLVANCRTMIMSDYGDWLAKGQTPMHIDLIKLATDESENKPVILFSFNPLEESEFAKIMGSLIMADLSRTASYKNESKKTNPFGLYVDEFQILAPETVKDMLEKARSSGFYITLSLQSIEQITVASSFGGEAVTKAILDTVQNFIVHAGSGLDTAETLSKIIGKMKVKNYRVMSLKQTGGLAFNFKNNKSGHINYEITDDWVVRPEKFQALSVPSKSNGYKSTAYYITKSCEDSNFIESNRVVARKVHIIAETEITNGVPDEFIFQFNKPRSKPLLWKKAKQTTPLQLENTDIEKQIEINNFYDEMTDNTFSVIEENQEDIPTITEDDLLVGLGNLGELNNKKTTSFQQMKKKK